MTNNLNDPGPAARKIADFLATLSTAGGLNLKSNILACNGQVQPNSSNPAGAPTVASLQPPTPSHTNPQENPQIKDPQIRVENPQITVELTGPDTPLLLARNGELLLAIEHIAAKILRLEPEEHDRISFDAEGFKATRNRELDLMAEMAIQKVRATGEPFSFSPMTSRERRILHLALAKSGLPTASSGEGPGRFVVLYPEGFLPGPPASLSAEDRTRAIRNSFRRR
ncbi:MAG TPA: R3H domain-containing nucleic acid-binding protein [Edaphobacter sp.]|jgi:spoIIIJ-associated protein|nr:R3H domain-containing nucleic acid-binding protein [Edaphobacter sp.]